MMEKQTEASAMKSNSVGASIKLGYGLYTSHFSNTFRATWLPALLFSVCFAALGVLSVVKLPALTTAGVQNEAQLQVLGRDYVWLLAAFGVLTVVGGLIETVFYSCGLSLLRGHKATGSMNLCKWRPLLDRTAAWRTIKAVLSILLLHAIPVVLLSLWYAFKLRHVLAAPGSHYVWTVFTVIAGVIFALALTPTLFVGMKYVLNDDERFWPLLKTDYLPAMRHLGFMLAVVISCAAIVLLATYVLQQPAVILTVANCQSSAGVANGDPSGMPSYMTALTAAIFFISGFAQAYIRLSALFPLYYMYGSIDTQEAERKRYRNEIKSQDYDTLTVH